MERQVFLWTVVLHLILKLSIQLELDELTLLLTCLTCKLFWFWVRDCTLMTSLFARLVYLWNVSDLQSACLFDIRVVHGNWHVCYLTSFVVVLLNFYLYVRQFAASAAHSLWPCYRNVSERVNDDWAPRWDEDRSFMIDTGLIVQISNSWFSPFKVTDEFWSRGNQLCF